MVPLFLQIMCFLFTVSYSLTDSNDLKILNDFRRGLDNPELLKWPENGDDDPCGPPSWPHVFCSGDRVSQIQVQNLGLEGPLPRSFNQLSKLTNVGLQGNRFSGEMPSFRGLSDLEFAYLDNNDFDSIPSDFFAGLTNVRVLALDRNPLNSTAGWSLSGDLAESFQLTNLSLVGCNVVGPIPEFLGAMPSLTVLKLSYNRLGGEIPASFGQSLVQILWLNDQEGDGIGGTIDVVASMTMLTQAWLHGNQFAGEIPATIDNLPSLQELNLNGNELVGLIPRSLASMELKRLDLSNNMFVGPIPTFKSVNVTFAGNYFCRPEPGLECSPEVDALLEFLRGVKFPARLVTGWSGNDPCGGPWVGLSCDADSEVSIINLPRQSLNGTLSPSIGRLRSVMEIRLPGNNLTGEVPANLTQLESLRLLDLAGNNLEPPLPRFLTTVKVVIDQNPLFTASRNAPPTSSSSPPKNSTAPTEDSESESEVKPINRAKKATKIISAVCSFSALAILGSFAFTLFRFKRKRDSSAKYSSSPIHTQSDPEKAVEIAISTNTTTTTTTTTSTAWTGSSLSPSASGGLAVSAQILRKATSGFSPENEVGRGGFGTVYRGELEDGTVVAVKRMEGPGMGTKAVEEFEAEVAALSRVRHRHLVSLLGYSVEGNERLLVYDYLPQGALSRHLFHWKSLDLEPLSWTKRLVVALDVARGMEYLHSLARTTFIHRDLKSSNILLGDDFRAKVADFGLVKLAPDGANSIATRLAGTFGYLAPEYAVMGKVTTKADVFSFGVVLMELVTGLTALDESRPEESRYLANWFHKIKTNRERLMEAVDPAAAAEEESVAAVAELAGHCTAREPGHRPDMGHVVSSLSALVEKWIPVADELEFASGIDFGLPLPQQLKAWQETESRENADNDTKSDVNDSNGSIPARPKGFAESLTSTDAR